MMVRSGRPPLKISTLAGSSRGNQLLSEAFPAKLAGMNPILDNPELFAVMQRSFHEELQKIASFHGNELPVLSFLNDPERYEQFLKEAGLWDALKSYGRNIKGYANQAKNTLTGGDYARQMKELSGSSGMTASSSKGLLASTPGPMREMAESRAKLDPAHWGLPAHTPDARPHPSTFHLSNPASSQYMTPDEFMRVGQTPFKPSAGPSRATQLSPGGSTPLFGAPRLPAPRNAPSPPPMSMAAAPAKAPAGPRRDLFAMSDGLDFSGARA